MRKSRTPGSVRGVSGNGYPYRDIAFIIASKKIIKSFIIKLLCVLLVLLNLGFLECALNL